MNKSDSIKALAAAMAKAQGELENANKNAANPHFRSRYADLAEVLNTVRPVLAKHGLSIVQMPSFEAGIASVETLLMHESGEWMSSVSSAPMQKQDAQSVGAATTYLRRYSLAAFAGVAQEDDDGNTASQPAPKSVQKSEPTLNKAQIADMKLAIESAGMSLDEFFASSRIPSLEAMPVSKIEGAKAWLLQQVAA